MSIERARALFRRYLEQQQDLGIRNFVGLKTAPLVAEANVSRQALLDELRAKFQNCLDCPLGKTRMKFVFGSGNPEAILMFVGEAPGADEDRQGEPFVGAAGQLLTKMIQAMGLSRDRVFIANILKCRPPANRTPQPDEIAACIHMLLEQIRIVQPRFICALGATAAHALLNSQESIGRLRGRFHDAFNAKLLVTYHPSALLRNPAWKRPAWEDLQALMNEMAPRQ